MCVCLPDLFCTQTKRVYSKQHLQVWITRPAQTRICTPSNLSTERTEEHLNHQDPDLMRWTNESLGSEHAQTVNYWHSVIVFAVMWASPGWYKHKTDDVCVCALFCQSESMFTCWGCVCPEAKGVSLAMFAQDDFRTFLSRLLLSMKQLNAKHTRRTKTHSDCVVIDTGSIFDYHFHIPCYLHGTPRYLKIPRYDHSTLPKKALLL